VDGARLINDYIADLTQRHPDRFAGLASLPWQLPHEAIREMDRAADQLGLRGVVLYSHVRGRPVDDPAFEPVYAHAEAKGLPIVFHPTVPSWGAAIKDHWMIPMMGLQVDTSFALLRLILAGVLERHPRLRVVLAHGGGALLALRGRLRHAHAAVAPARQRLREGPEESIARFYFDTIVHDGALLRALVDFAGPEHVLLGSDYPFDMGDLRPAAGVRACRLLPDVEAAILGGNAERLLATAGVPREEIIG
jgi:predicted TIM-barrel fold metal-dependent hydrolase